MTSSDSLDYRRRQGLQMTALITNEDLDYRRLLTMTAMTKYFGKDDDASITEDDYGHR
jgi:hypothetical protein